LLFSDVFRSVFTEADLFDMVSSADIDKMSPDTVQKQTRCTRDECATIIGEQLGVDRVISSSLRKIDQDSLYLTAKVINIKDGSIIASKIVEHQGPVKSLIPSVEKLATLLIEDLKGTGKTSGRRRTDLEKSSGTQVRREKNRFNVGLSYMGYNSDFFSSSYNPVALFRFDYDVWKLSFSLELISSARDLKYQYSYSVPYGQVNEERSYSFKQANLVIGFFPIQAAVEPYFGVFGGVMELNEAGINDEYFEGTAQKLYLYPYGFLGGVRFFSDSPLNLNLEARYTTHRTDKKRDTIGRIIFGEVQKAEEKVDISGFLVGLGIGFQF
ncbi:MAG: hypothetical protein GY866_42345, partial [Proteobacteria bacterium]|nr:hypothetical protein [Pseudomonadota bacterium]